MTTANRIYELLPRIYRLRVDGSGELRQLIDVIAAQIDVLEESLDQFYDDLFIETAADWAVPYIGDLVGYRPLEGGPPAVATPRAEVANTIAYRRRKGTAAMLEQLAYDVTGWRARAVEFFELLATTQYMNHPRRGRGKPPDLRDPLRLAVFDDSAHLAEVRRIATGAGRYNIHNVGLFLWRLDAVELSDSPLVPDAGSQRRFRFHPLGIDQPLFGRPRTEEEITHLAEPYDVPLPLARRWLKRHQDAYYGRDRSLRVDPDAGASISICDLSDVDNDWAHAPQPGSGIIAIDPELGRVYFADDVTDPSAALGTFHLGMAYRVGGGGYSRALKSAEGPLRSVSLGADLQTELDQVADGGVVEIADNHRYEQTTTVHTGPGATVVLRSAYRRWPVVAGPVALKPGDGGTVVLDGLLISGGTVQVDDNGSVEARTVILRHCTVVPGSGAVKVLHPYAKVQIERCILGAVEVADGVSVSIRDSVLDSHDGGALALDECTVTGAVQAATVEISNCIIMGTVTAQRRQTGCVRFSRLAGGSRTPAQHRCTSVAPSFTSLRFGDPGYAQLRPGAPNEIRQGADNESEMGVGNHLYAPQREANLRVRLHEYLRFGLEAGIFFAT